MNDKDITKAELSNEVNQLRDQINQLDSIRAKNLQLKEEIEKIESKYLSLVEKAGAGVVSSDIDGNCTYINDTLCNIIGYSKKELMGRHFAEFLHPDDKEKIMRLYAKGSKNPKENINLEFRVINKNGTTVHLYCTPTVFWHKNKIAGFNAIIHDITKRKLIEHQLQKSKEELESKIKERTKKLRKLNKEMKKELKERKKVEEELKKSEAKLRSIVENAGAGVVSTDWRGRATYVNNALCKMIGRAKAELIGKHFSEFLHPEDKQDIMKLYWSAFTQKSPKENLNLEFRAIHKNGYPVYLYCNPTIFWYKGRITGFNGIIIDITSRKKAEVALQESEEKYRSLSDQSLVGIFILKNGKIIYANQGLSDISEYSTEEMLSWGAEEFSKMIHPIDREFVIEQGRKKQSGQKDVIPRYSYQMITKSGRIKYVEIYSKTINFGSEFGAQGVVIDSTEQKKAEEAVKESEEKFRNLFENASDAIYTIDKEGIITTVNKMAEDITGYLREELIGKHFNALLVDEDKQKGFDGFEQSLSGQNHSYTIRIRIKDGEIRTLSINAAPLIKKGKIIGGQGIARDITEQRKLEKKVKESEMRFKGIFDSANDAIVVINRDGFITLANQRFFELTGYSSNDTNKIHLSQFLHPEDCDYFLLHFNKAVNGIGEYQRFVARSITKNGMIRYVDINANVITKGKNTIELQAIMRDITDKKVLEDKLKENYKELIKTIAGFLEIKDLYTEEHSRRIVEDSIYLSRRLNMSIEEIKDVEIAALLHDLGKIKIPGKILNKNGKYNKKEEQIMRKHSQLGEEAIVNIPEFQKASKLIRHHHERYDGTGYPDGLKGEQIPLGARIIAVVDAFDAMQSDRPYRKALTYEDAKQELISERGKQFDPHLTDIYLKYLKAKYEKN
jgi:PAS domain S-box-containing protein